jgi:predicted O-linked N-acetylglucosamine transferase (SPINDLY family)
MNELYRPSVTPEGPLELARGWDRAFAPENPPRLPLRRPRPIEPIRVGFVSADFYRAPVGYFLAGLFRHLDRRQITTIVYSDAERQDDLTADLRGNARLWRSVRALSDEHLLRAIRADGLHVLFNLSGHIRGNRMLVFARRAAPIQVLWVGYAGTTGVKAMDYILADRFHIPEGEEANFSERVLRMPNDYVCYEPPPYAPAVGALPADRNRGVTFAAFHNAAKAGAAAIDLWARVLKALPNARILLAYKKLDDPVVRARIERRFSEAGIDPARLVIEGGLPHVELLRRYGEADIALDSFPYSGGLTTIEALWMGVPVVTLPGRTFAGRHSLSHVSSAGFRDLIAADADDYVRIAVGLAEDVTRLRELRRTLRARLQGSPILDTARYARDFTALIRGVVAAVGDGAA